MNRESWPKSVQNVQQFYEPIHLKVAQRIYDGNNFLKKAKLLLKNANIRFEAEVERLCSEKNQPLITPPPKHTETGSWVLDSWSSA